MEELERCLAALDGSVSSAVISQAKAAAATVKQELESHKQTAAARSDAHPGACRVPSRQAAGTQYTSRGSPAPLRPARHLTPAHTRKPT
jgi:hypothetical protein